MHTANPTKYLNVAPTQPPQVITIPHDDLECIIFRGEHLIEQTQQQPFFKNKSRYQVINTLISQAKIERNYIRLSILYFARTAYVSQAKLEKWGIIKLPIGNGMWVYELLADWNKPTTKKGKFKATATAKKTKQKTVNNGDNDPLTEQAIKAMTAFCYYTDLHQTNPNFTPPKLHNHADLSKVNNNEILQCFEDYLDYEEQTIENLENSTDIQYQFYNFMQSKAPTDHRMKSCRKGSTQYFYNKKRKTVDLHNEHNCQDTFCPYCNNTIGYQKEQLAKQVQERHIEQGGECLQLTLTPPPHTKATRLEPIKDKMQQGYELFCERTAKLINDLGYQGKLKRFDPVYSLKHGHHPHIHVAYAVGEIEADQLATLSAIMHDIWLDCMIEVKLLKKKDRPTIKAKGKAFDLRKNPQAFSYVARQHKSNFTLADLPQILVKVKLGKALTTYELGFLAMTGYVKEPVFERIYQEILTAFYDTHQLQYSKGFLSKLGLKEYRHSNAFKLPKAVTGAIVPPSNQTPQNPPKIEPQTDKKGQCLLDLQPPRNDTGQFLLFGSDDTKKSRKQRSDKGLSRTPKPPPPMTATPTHTETGQGVLFKGIYTPHYPTMSKPSRKHLVPLATLTYEQQTALEQARAVGLYTGMLKHAYEKGYFKNNVPFS